MLLHKPMHGISIVQPLSLAIAVSGLLITSIPQRVQALSLACCASLEEMEQNSELIIRGQALLDFDEVKEVHFSQDEYQVYLETGNSLPLGTSIVVHDDEWQLVERIVALPVEVLEVIEGETDNQTINVVQHNDWGAIPMKKGAEYLLFLSQSQQLEPIQHFYYNFYGQGTYNLDGTDLRASSAGYYDAEAIEEQYGDRVEFVAPSEKSVQIVPIAVEGTNPTWFSRLFGGLQAWFKDDWRRK